MVCQNSLYNSHQVEGWSIRKEIVIYVQRISCKKAIELVVLGCPLFRKIAKKGDDYWLGVARLTEKPKNRTEIAKTEPIRNRNLAIFQKPNRTETEVINRG